MNIERIAIVGMGALGVLYGDFLTERLGRGRVGFVVDAERRARYERMEITANGRRCDFRLIDANESGHTADLVIFAVKATALEQAMEDGAFLRMTAPGGVSVEDAYYALHRSDIQQATMTAALRRAAVYLTNAIRSGTLRPREAGTSAQAPTVTTIDYRSATPEQREAIKRRIREG